MSPASDFAAWGRRTRKLQAAAIAAAAAALFVWVAASSITKPAVVSPPHSAVATGAETDLYPLLARGFLKGRLSLDADVPASLARESDPYDPGRLSAPHLHDASYYRGKYYAYFGPAPALTLFLPYRILAGRDLPSPAAVTFFCLGCYAGMIALFAAAAGDRANQCPFSLVPAVLLALGGTSFLLPLLRRPAFYEVAIAAGSCFLLWSFFFLARLRATARPVLCSCLCGLLLGLATASRPTTAFGFAPLAAGIFLLNRRRSRPGKTADLAAAGAAFGAIVGLLGLYNYLRFGSPFEFGQKYQLSAATEGSLRHFSFSYLPFQARIYLVSALGHSRYFPFFQPIAPAMLPPGIGGYEYAYGVFANLPVAAFALVPLARALTGAGRENRDIVFVLFGALVVSLAPVLLFFGSCVRYMADFAPVLAVIASLGMVESVDWAGRTGPGAAIWLSRLAAAAAAASFAVAFLASVDMYDSAPATPPPALDRLGNLLNRPVVWWDQAHGIRPGPRRIEVILPAAAAGSEPLITAASPSGNCDSIWLEDMDSHSVRFVFRRDELSPADRSPEIALDYGRPHLIGISMGALLPIRPGEMAHPVPRSTFAALRTWLHLELDGRVVWELPIIPRSERCDEIRVGRSASGRKSAVFSGRILSDAVLPARSIALDRPPIGGVALSLNLNPDMAGRSFPLVSTGRAGSGNILLLAVGRGGEVRFGYDHWGKPTLWSGEVEAAKSSPHRLEFWMPSVLGGNPPQPLVVNWDGRRVWIENVPYFPASRNEIFVGRNPLGGTGCEVRLINAQVEDLNLPPPAPAHGL